MATKYNLIENIVKKLDYMNREDANLAVECILEYLKEELVKGNRIEIRGFGTLSLRKRKYAGKDKEYNSIYYRMSKNVQDELNQ